MIRYLKNRFRAYVRRIAAEVAVQPDILDLASKVQLQFDIDPIAERVVDLVKTGHAVEYDILAECIDIEELAKQFDTADLAGEMDYSSLAGEVDMSQLAREFDTSEIARDISLSDIAGEFDEDDLAEKMIESLDYKRLARALLAEVAQAR
jgi:hypothetical protein